MCGASGIWTELKVAERERTSEVNSARTTKELGWSSKMTARQNTIVCTFEPARPRISALDIHEWIHETLRIPEHKVSMIQIDDPKKKVYIKLTDSE